jgi:hypothetical protein
MTSEEGNNPVCRSVKLVVAVITKIMPRILNVAYVSHVEITV